MSLDAFFGNHLLQFSRVRLDVFYGSHGISADFGSKAAGAFADAFAAVVAGLNESLRYMGPIPDRAKNQLLITGTALGSFGFEFELPGQKDDSSTETTRAEDALQKMQSLFRVSAQGSDDDVAELVEEVHPRAVKKVSDFLTYLVQQQAWCGLEFKEQLFRFDDIKQLRASAARLQEENIHERDEEYIGEILGVLPHSRTFELKLNNTDLIIKGKVDIAIEDPAVLNREWLHKSVSLTLHVIQVGQGRPRFTLPDLSFIKLITAS
jgi:hypothetical protein